MSVRPSRQPDRDRLDQILVDCRAVHSFLNRIESRIRDLIASCADESLEKPPRMPQDASQGADPCDDQSNAKKPQEGAKSCVLRNSVNAVQIELFPTASDGKLRTDNPNPSETTEHSPEKPAKPSFLHKKGFPTLTRRQVLDNYHRIVSTGEQLLDLSDVNRIFGYNPSTSGTFVRHAVKRGDLGAVPCGRKLKFVALDVRAFIKSHYDSLSTGKGTRKPRFFPDGTNTEDLRKCSVSRSE